MVQMVLEEDKDSQHLLHILVLGILSAMEEILSLTTCKSLQPPS